MLFARRALEFFGSSGSRAAKILLREVVLLNSAPYKYEYEYEYHTMRDAAQQDVGLGLGLAVGGLLLQDADDLLVVPPQDAVADAGLNPNLLRRNAGAQAEASVDDEAVVQDDASEPESVGHKHNQLTMVRSAIQFLNSSYQQSLTIDDICRRVGSSKYHFCRVFRAVTGKTVVDYLNFLRCERAQF